MRQQNIVKKGTASRLVSMMQCLNLALGRIRIVTVRVFCSNPTVLSVNYEFRLLIAGNLPGNFYRLRLRGGNLSCLGITRAFYLPSAAGMWGNMLILSHVILPPLFSRQVEEVIMQVTVWRRPHVLLVPRANSRDYIGVGGNVDLDSARILFQKVMKDGFLEIARIVTALDIDLVDLQKALGVVTSRFHLDSCGVHHSVSPFCCNYSFVFTNRKRPILCLHRLRVAKYAGLQERPKRDTIRPCTENGVMYQLWLSLRQAQESSISADTSRRVLLFFNFPVCIDYFRCSSSRTTMSVLVSSSNSGKNCFAFSRNLMPVCCSKYLEKSFALMRTHPSFSRGSNS